MSIRFACMHCGKKMEAKSKHAGRKVRCLACGRRIVIPEAQDTEAAMVVEHRSRGGGAGAFLLGVVCALLVVVGGTLAAFKLGVVESSFLSDVSEERAPTPQQPDSTKGKGPASSVPEKKTQELRQLGSEKGKSPIKPEQPSSVTTAPVKPAKSEQLMPATTAPAEPAKPQRLKLQLPPATIVPAEPAKPRKAVPTPAVVYDPEPTRPVCQLCQGRGFLYPLPVNRHRTISLPRDCKRCNSSGYISTPAHRAWQTRQYNRRKGSQSRWKKLGP